MCGIAGLLRRGGEEGTSIRQTVIGMTAGASTPNNKIGETIVRICETAGVAPDLAS